jgi:hypothetical protein
MSDRQLICEHCLAANELRAEIAARGTAVANCSICGRSGGRALPSDDDAVKRIFRALVRLHFSEWEYNGHIGGGSLQDVVRQSHAIFDLGPDASDEDFEQAFLVLEEDWYPPSPDQISLGGGYWDGGVLWGLREQRDLEVTHVLRDSLVRNYFDVEPAARNIFKTLRPHVSTTLPAGDEFVRGRVGVKARLVRKDWVSLRQSPSFSYLPYTGKEIGAPPVPLVGAGRLNRAHVSILYVASDVATAVAELRPHPGHLISTARFRLKRGITIANLAESDIRGYLNDDKLEVLRTILSVADVLNLPVQPDQQNLYSATQVLSDAIRAEGFDGVSFRSSVGPGSNLACFDADAFEFVEGSEEVHEVSGLAYGIKRVEAQPTSYDQGTFEQDSTDPLSNLVHGMSRRSQRA